MTCSRWLPNSTNLNQSQLSNTKPPAMYRKRRFEWSFRAAPHAHLSAAPRAGLAPLQRVHVLRVQLCLPNHPMLVTPTNTSTWSLTSVSREIKPENRSSHRHCAVSERRSSHQAGNIPDERDRRSRTTWASPHVRPNGGKSSKDTSRPAL